MKTYSEYLYLQIYKTKCILKDLETLQNSETDKATRNDMLQRVVIKGESLANNLRQMLLQYSVVTPEFHKEQISRRNGYLIYISILNQNWRSIYNVYYNESIEFRRICI